MHDQEGQSVSAIVEGDPEEPGAPPAGLSAEELLRAELFTARMQLEAAQRSIGEASAAHQEDIQRLQSELSALKEGLVGIQESVSWRVTEPLRRLRGLVRGRSSG